MRVVIYGASDDLVEVDGDIREEFNAWGDDAQPQFLAVDDGTLLRITYDGIWNLRVIEEGMGTITVHRAISGEDRRTEDIAGIAGNTIPAYSDVVVVEVEDEIDWVMFGVVAARKTADRERLLA